MFFYWANKAQVLHFLYLLKDVVSVMFFSSFKVHVFVIKFRKGEETRTIKTDKLLTLTQDSKLCENIGIFIKYYKSANSGSNKVVYGPCEQESEEKK